MTRIGRGRGRYGGLALSAAGALWLAGAAQPALAGDDGAAPLWVGIGSMFKFVGVGGGDDQPAIEYRDHARLVVPPKMDLPPPATAPSASATDWPRDPDIEVVKKRKAEEKAKPNNAYVMASRRSKSAVPATDPVTTNYTAGMGPTRRCTAGPGSSCDTARGPSLNWNPLTWVGVEKKPQTVLGPEPDRESLTDPPPGYRAPAEGAGVKVDAN